MVLVCASANVHKVEEMNALLTDIVHLVPRPAELGEVHETGSTLLENAVIKAEAVAAFVHADAIADAHTNTMSGCVTVYEKVLPAEAERLPLTALASQRCALIPLMPDRAKNLIRCERTPFLLLCLVPRQNAALLRSLT